MNVKHIYAKKDVSVTVYADQDMPRKKVCRSQVAFFFTYFITRNFTSKALANAETTLHTKLLLVDAD